MIALAGWLRRLADLLAPSAPLAPSPRELIAWRAARELPCAVEVRLSFTATPEGMGVESTIDFVEGSLGRDTQTGRSYVAYLVSDWLTRYEAGEGFHPHALELAEDDDAA